MSLRRQSTLLLLLAGAALIATLLSSGLALRRLQDESEQIELAEAIARSVTNFRYLTMETVLYREQRSQQQWRSHVARFRQSLAGRSFGNASQDALLARERANLELLARQFERLMGTGHVANGSASGPQAALVASTASALFLTTQDMLDDAYELMRLNRADLATAEKLAALSMLLSIVILSSLTVATALVVRRRVLAPVAALQALTEQVMRGNLDLRLNMKVGNEIGTLSGTFDRMTEQLQSSRAAIERENAERRLAEADLQRSVDQLARTQGDLQTILDHTPALVVYWDRQLRNRFANHSYVDWFGITPEQMRGRQMQELLGPQSFADVESKIASVLQGNSEVFERIIELPSGAQRHALFSYFPEIVDGEVKGFYGFASDVTQLKEAQQGQAEALAQLQSVLDAALDFSIIATDLDGTIKLFSAGSERMLGYQAADLVGKASPAVLHRHDELVVRGQTISSTLGQPVSGFEVFVARARRGQSETREWTYVCKDGSTVPVSLTVTGIRDAQGALTGFLGIAKDVRVEREVRQALAAARDQAQAASIAKSQFLANMSHEIRTPMNAILGMLGLLQHTGLSALQLDYVDKSTSAAESLLGLLNDILDFSRIEAGKLELESAPFRPDQLMRELSVILSALIGNKDVEILFEVDPALPAQLLGDAARLRQILLNLSGNAVKFTESGEIVIAIRMVGAGDQQCDIAFSVKDSGIGIGEDELVRIFEGFEQAEASTTRRFGGTGLGLTISRRLVEAMGGQLLVESRLGKGSTFHFTARFAVAAAAQAQAPWPAPGAVGARPLRVLVIDDNDHARANLAATVESFGWRADPAASGEAALEMIGRHGAADPYDVMLVDWRMPGMDGWMFTRTVRADAGIAATPIVIMVTACGRGALVERQQSERNLLNGFLTKPVTSSMVFDAITDALAGTRDGGRPRQAGVSTGLAGLKLLVVDDNAMNQQVASELLAKAGATVEVASGGFSGVHKVVQADPPFDAVLMDIQMPDMDGYTATALIRKDPRMHALPIIAMTANVMAGDRDACLRAGMDDHIGKPIAIDALVALLQRYCGTQPPGGPAQPATASAPEADAGGAVHIDGSAALARMGGNVALYLSLARLFPDDAQTWLPQLRRELSRPGFGKAAALLHSFRGSAGVVGAVQLQRFCSQLERALTVPGAHIDAKASLAQLQLLIEPALAELASFAARRASEAGGAPASGAPPASLAQQLAELERLLEASNMGAVAAFAALERDIAAESAAALAPLAARMARLDFQQALLCCRQLRTELS